MDDNLPQEQNDQKLKGLESDLKDIESRAKEELNKPQGAQMPGHQQQATQTPIPAAPPTPIAHGEGQTQTPEAPEMPKIPPTQNMVPQQPGSKSKVLVWIALGFLVIALAGAAAFYFISGSKNQNPTPTPTPSTISTPSPNPETSWKIYQDADYTYTFKYPQDWTISTATSSSKVTTLMGLGDGGSNVKFEVGPYPDKLRTGETLKDYVERVGSAKFLSASYTTLSDGTDVYKRIIDNSSDDPTYPRMVSYAFNKGTTVYAADGFTANIDKDEKLFDSIISTFKFIEATPSASPTVSPSSSPLHPL